MSRGLLSFYFIICLCCFDVMGSSTNTFPSVDAEGLMKWHNTMSSGGVLGEFVSAVSASRYDKAYELLNAELGSAWTRAHFIKDWESIRAELGSRMLIEATESFSGRTVEGFYSQACYSLESNALSHAGLKLFSRNVGGKSKVFRVEIRMPKSTELPQGAFAFADGFEKDCRNGAYEALRQRLSPAATNQFAEQVLGRFQSFFDNAEDSILRSYYKLCLDGEWYDVILFEPKGNLGDYLEIVIQNTEGKCAITSFFFKRRMLANPSPTTQLNQEQDTPNPSKDNPKLEKQDSDKQDKGNKGGE